MIQEIFEQKRPAGPYIWRQRRHIFGLQLAKLNHTRQRLFWRVYRLSKLQAKKSEIYVMTKVQPITVPVHNDGTLDIVSIDKVSIAERKSGRQALPHN